MSRFDPHDPPRAIILPDNQPPEDRAAFVASLVAEHGDFILKEAHRRANLQPASGEDVQQRVLLMLHEHLYAPIQAQKMSFEQTRNYLGGVVRKEAANYTRARRRGLPGGADGELLVSPAMDPERAVSRAEHRAKIMRHIEELSPEERAVVRGIDLEGMSLKEVAARMGIPVGTVSTIHTRARKNLKDLALASERAATLAGRARRGGGR